MVDILILIIILALPFDVSNGWNDSANAIATVVSTKVLSPLAAVSMAAVMNIAGAFLTTAVAKTIGVKMLKLQPVHGFAAETSATFIIVGASALGLPVSTTHVISTAIIGVGATTRLSAVRWGVAGKIVLAWVLTLPVCIGFAWGIMKLIG